MNSVIRARVLAAGVAAGPWSSSWRSAEVRVVARRVGRVLAGEGERQHDCQRPQHRRGPATATAALALLGAGGCGGGAAAHRREHLGRVRIVAIDDRASTSRRDVGSLTDLVEPVADPCPSASARPAPGPSSRAAARRRPPRRATAAGPRGRSCRARRSGCRRRHTAACPDRVVERGAERPHVARGGGRRARRDLGGEVGRRAGHQPGLGEASASSSERAMPKSLSLAAPFAIRMLLRLHVAVHDAVFVGLDQRVGGLRQQRRRLGGVHRPEVRTRSLSVWPSTYSITSQCTSSSSTRSKTDTTWGWLSAAASRASRSARSSSALSAPGIMPMRLIATLRPSTSSSARWTVPEPPRPISRLERVPACDHVPTLLRPRPRLVPATPAHAPTRRNPRDHPNVLDELEWRGLIAHSTDRDALRAALGEGSVKFYVGFDPTAPSLHMGNLVQLVTARRLQDAGHTPYILVGGATGMIGDPRTPGSARSTPSTRSRSGPSACGSRSRAS